MPADVEMAVEETKWHSIPVAEILTLQSTSPEGLSDSEAEARLKQYGTNELTPPPKPSFLMKVFIQINNILIYILIAALIVTGPSLFLPTVIPISCSHGLVSA
jgi:magnesium-transporting ATPase (P-type)